MTKVHWVDLEQMAPDNSVPQKLRRLFDAAGACEGLEEGMRVALKVNTAEDGYEYGLRPVFVRVAADTVREATERSPVVSDGLKLVDYWQRAKGHTFLDVARAKGYTADALGANFVINGGYSGDEGNAYPCRVADSELGGVEVGTAVCRTNFLWVLSHVTLHPLFGLAGALYNGGFDCLIGRERERVLGDLDAYPFNGTRPARGALARFRSRALEGHLGVREAMNGKIFYVNYLWDVTPQPEYFPFSGTPVTRNLGFLASRDPVALDAASLDLLARSAREEGHPEAGADLLEGIDEVLRRAQEIGLGSLEYTLERLS